MIIQIFHKEQWRYITEKDGSRSSLKKESAYSFSKSEGEKMVGYLRSIGFNVQTV